MLDAEDFVMSLVCARTEDLQRRDALRRRRADYIVREDETRAKRSEEELKHVLYRGTDYISLVEHNFRRSLDDMGRWWDLLSEHVIKEKRECEEAERLQKHMTDMCLSTFTKRELSEQVSVVEKDERRLAELEELLVAEDKAAKEESVEEAMQRVLMGAEKCIDFLDSNSLTNRSTGSLLTCTALHSFIQSIAGVPVSIERSASITFGMIFGHHPFRLVPSTFLMLLHTLYNKMWSNEPAVNRFDICKIPLFLVDGPKFSGKSLVSHHVATRLSLLHISDRDLVNRALEAYHSEREGLPTLLATESSDDVPYIRAYEEHDENNDETAYHSHERVMQTVESVMRLSPWAVAGEEIEGGLLHGRPVEPSLIVHLMQLQMKDTLEGCSGILFDGAVAGLEELQRLQLIIPPFVHPFKGALNNWPSPPPLPPSSTDDGAPTEENQAQRLLVVQREARLEQPVVRGEGKTRPSKKGVDLSTLPPPVLPEVVYPELAPEEREAIERWEGREEDTNTLFSAMVYIHCGTQEIFNRFAGLRVDKETGEQYHMIFCPPPPERVPHVVNLDRTRTSTALLHRVVLEQRRKWDALRRSLTHENGSGGNLYEVDGEQALDGIVSNVARVISSRQRIFEENMLMYEAAMGAKKQKKWIEDTIVEMRERREAERKRLIKIYTESGVPIPHELEDTSPLPSVYTMPEETPQLFFRGLAIFTSYYNGIYGWTGAAVESLVRILLGYRKVAMEKYERFWNQPDEKQGKLDRFVENYNNIPLQLLGQAVCKNELHLLVDQLRDELFSIAEATGRDVTTRIDLITKKENFLGPWSTTVCNVAIATVKGEIERFMATLNMVLIYFSTVVNEPCVFEELESEAVMTRAGVDGVQELAKGKDKKVQGSKKPQRPEDLAEKTGEDMLVEAIGKLVTTITNYVEKLQGPITASQRVRENAKAAAAAADDGRFSLILTKCMPFVHEELASMQERIGRIRQFFVGLMREAEQYCANCRDTLLAKAKEGRLSSASAINTAIYTLRNAIETERAIPPLHLGQQTFSVLSGGPKQDERAVTPLSPYEVTSVHEVPMIHRTLSATRLMSMIRTFRNVAPDYTLASAEFFYIVQPDDYAGAQTRSVRLKTRREVFESFDPHGCGYIDWREFVLHLMLWCEAVPDMTRRDEPNNYYIRECSIEELLETKTALLGAQEVDEETFSKVPFYFAKDLSDDRLGAYMQALWLTFADDDGKLCPTPLLAMMCADRQPVRGAQKAFAVFPSAQDGLLTPWEIDCVSHMLATNPRNMCLPDVFSKENIDILYHGERALSFDSVCELVMGRSMLNSTKAFLRKTFAIDVD
ncbi:hypothetical protein DPX39_100087300 [Trypanosoma brucei equiperdum]|uniref:EF-hand domain-containing protein n=1 Tax=Trypanosoma brucei equiperdum TaxID=630700 RepID=A0A3L6L185_9TRYP|nr:hypothetical protein DPX39_100087300 [Trypanosoma brucei equiperdum]